MAKKKAATKGEEHEAGHEIAKLRQQLADTQEERETLKMNNETLRLENAKLLKLSNARAEEINELKAQGELGVEYLGPLHRDPNFVLQCVALMRDRMTGGPYDDKSFDHQLEVFIPQAFKIARALDAEFTKMNKEAEEATDAASS